MTLKEIKERLRVAIQEMDTEAQKELLLKLKKYKKQRRRTWLRK